MSKEVTREKKKAWSEFSRWIRLSNAVDEFVTCYTCGNSKHYKKMHAGHGIGGRSNSVLFNEKIVKPQCVGCNIFANGRYAVFTRKLIDELGLKGYDEIVKKANTIVRYKLNDYKEIREKYKKLNETFS